MSTPGGTPEENFLLALMRAGYSGLEVYDPVKGRVTKVRKIRRGLGIESDGVWYWIGREDAVSNWEMLKKRNDG
ncbi:hypothetical protein HYS82_02235 [Candidatus Amesbacteria bacterium]|nr:hypothetical protein [Candidatus Amesbacteria bacterium]